MESNNPVNNLLNEMEKLGMPVQELREKVNEATNKGETPVRNHTVREEKLYKAAEKVLDKTFVAYGKVKDKAVPMTIQATQKAISTSRSWLGDLLKKVGEKIEPKS